MKFKNVAILTLVFVFVLAGVAVGYEYPDLSDEEITVYITFHEEEGRRLLERFSDLTGVSYEYLRLPTGEATSRVLAEMENPQADFILGGTNEAHERLANEGALRPYRPAFADDIPDMYRSNEDYWTGFYLGPLSIFINNSRWEAEFPDVEKPTTFDDLLNPAFEGEIIMPNPTLSGTGYNFLASMVQLRGEDEAFEYFRELEPNVGEFTSSGFTPAQRTGIGEYLIAINFIHDQMLVSKAGFDVESIVPEGAGWEIGANSIIADGPNPQAAEAFADFLSSREAGQLHTDITQRLSVRNDVELPEGATPLDELPINEDYSFEQAAGMMEDLQNRWEDEIGY